MNVIWRKAPDSKILYLALDTSNKTTLVVLTHTHPFLTPRTFALQYYANTGVRLQVIMTT